MPVAREVMTHARAQPGRIAVRCDDQALSYDDLAGAANSLAAWLRQDRGLLAGQLVALRLADPAELLIAMLAVDLAGGVPLVCDPSWGPEHLAATLGPIQPDVLVTELPSVRRVAAAFDPSPAEPDDDAWAGFTSGSTGRPRAVVRTRRSWVGSYPAVTRLTGLAADDTVLAPGPLASSLYSFAALHTLAVGATLVLRGRWPAAALAESARQANVTHLVPHALDVVVSELERRDRRAEPSRLRTAVVGGAALPARLRERAAAVGVHVVAYYGASELSFVAVDADGSGLRPFPGAEIDLRPTNDPKLRKVWVRSPWTARGYLAGATGPLRRNDNGWTTVGDLAAPGLPLRLRGRGDGAVVTGGATVVPEDVESVLGTVAGVRGIVVVGTRHQRLGSVVTAVVETGGAPVPRSALVAAARAGLAPVQRPRRWLAVDALPRTAGGKPARGLISEGLLSGKLPTRPMT